MKILLKLIVLIVIETILFWLFSRGADPSASIGMIFLVPAACGISLILAGFVFIAIKPPNDWYRVFLINSLIAPVIIYYAFTMAIEKTQRDTYVDWRFVDADTSYSIILTKKEGDFEITRQVNTGPVWVIKQGAFYKIQSEYKLLDSTGALYIRNDYLIGFKPSGDSIKLIEVQN